MLRLALFVYGVLDSSSEFRLYWYNGARHYRATTSGMAGGALNIGDLESIVSKGPRDFPLPQDYAMVASSSLDGDLSVADGCFSGARTSVTSLGSAVGPPVRTLVFPREVVADSASAERLLGSAALSFRCLPSRVVYYSPASIKRLPKAWTLQR